MLWSRSDHRSDQNQIPRHKPNRGTEHTQCLQKAVLFTHSAIPKAKHLSKMSAAITLCRIVALLYKYSQHNSKAEAFAQQNVWDNCPAKNCHKLHICTGHSFISWHKSLGQFISEKFRDNCAYAYVKLRNVHMRRSEMHICMDHICAYAKVRNAHMWKSEMHTCES